MTRTRRFLIALFAALTVIAVGAMAFRAWISSEDRELDEAARALASGSFIQLADGLTHYEIFGSDTGRVVVLVHGFSVPYYIWDSTAVGLTNLGYRVLRYDLFGRGYSDRPIVEYDGEFYDNQLRGLLDSLRIRDPVDLVGLSFGGFVTAHFVGTHPSRVHTLTFVDPMSQRPDIPATLGFPVLGPWLWDVTVVPGLAAGQMTDFLHPENYPTWVDQYRPQMEYKGFGHALFSTMRMASRVDFDVLFGNVAQTGVPVLLIWGRQDQTISFTLSEVVRRNIPSLEFFPVDSAGHLPHIEQASLVNDRIHAFLEAHPARGSAER